MGVMSTDNAPDTARPSSSGPGLIPAQALLEHWQGHRRVTRRVIDAFPDEKLFTFSIGGMRPFGVLALELLTMGVPMMRGVVHGAWDTDASREPLPKAELLKRWDAATAEIDRLWKEVPPERFDETLTAFGQFTDKTYTLLLYVIDNEIHHRGQGYVYLRALGIEPPPFYDRS
jgi:uncharacterized damage-inducible protein DinB